MFPLILTHTSASLSHLASPRMSLLDDLHLNQTTEFIHIDIEDDNSSNSQLSARTPLPFLSAANEMDFENLISTWLQDPNQELNNPNLAYQLNEVPSLLSTHPFEFLAPLAAINTPPTLMQTAQRGNHYINQSSMSASNGEKTRGTKRSEASTSLSPEPQPPMSKKRKAPTRLEAAEKVIKKPKPRPINARALALDREVLMLHEIDRPVAERMIRDKLGNNPDTSKSLRRLAMEGKVVRHGAGGRGEPFRYELTDLGKVIYRELMSTKGREG